VLAHYQRSFLAHCLIQVCVIIRLNSKDQRVSLCFASVFCFFSPLLQYASVKKNDDSFMSPQDFVERFLHAHTDIRLSDDAANLLAGVVDQKKDGSV